MVVGQSDFHRGESNKLVYAVLHSETGKKIQTLALEVIEFPLQIRRLGRIIDRKMNFEIALLNALFAGDNSILPPADELRPESRWSQGPRVSGESLPYQLTLLDC